MRGRYGQPIVLPSFTATMAQGEWGTLAANVLSGRTGIARRTPALRGNGASEKQASCEAFACRIRSSKIAMAAYVIVEIDIHDPESYARYMALVPASIAAFGGRYLARGGKAETLEGDWTPKRIVLLEFPSAERAHAWWSAPEYAYIKSLRQTSAHSRMIVVEGLPDGSRS
jgi:uncharacterized protein (DUF1330 family)